MGGVDRSTQPPGDYEAEGLRFDEMGERHDGAGPREIVPRLALSVVQ